MVNIQLQVKWNCQNEKCYECNKVVCFELKTWLSKVVVVVEVGDVVCVELLFCDVQQYIDVVVFIGVFKKNIVGCCKFWFICQVCIFFG